MQKKNFTIGLLQNIQNTVYKLDMGKSCIRFKKTDDIPYDLITQLLSKMNVEEWIDIYEKTIKK